MKRPLKDVKYAISGVGPWHLFRHRWYDVAEEVARDPGAFVQSLEDTTHVATFHEKEAADWAAKALNDAAPREVAESRVS
jgi:hypothetical protein